MLSISLEILRLILVSSAKSCVLGKSLGVGMWENQEPSDSGFRWIQSSPDRCRHGGNQSPREMWKQKGTWGTWKRNTLVILLNKILLNSLFWLRKLKTIYLCKYHGRYFIFSFFDMLRGKSLEFKKQGWQIVVGLIRYRMHMRQEDIWVCRKQGLLYARQTVIWFYFCKSVMKVADTPFYRWGNVNPTLHI